MMGSRRQIQRINGTQTPRCRTKCFHKASLDQNAIKLRHPSLRDALIRPSKQTMATTNVLELRVNPVLSGIPSVSLNAYQCLCGCCAVEDCDKWLHPAATWILTSVPIADTHLIDGRSLCWHVMQS